MKQKKKMLILGGARKSCLVVIRELREKGFHITIGNDKRICLGFFTRYANRRLITPSPRNPDHYIDFLLKEVKNNKYEMVYSTGQDITDILSLNRDELAKYVRVLVPEYETIKKAVNKISTMRAAMEAGIPIPKTYFPTRDSIDDLSCAIDYPVLIKPAVGTGARGIAKARTSEELRHKFRLIENMHGQSFVQEFVPQPHDQYKADVLFDLNCEPVAEIVYKKHRYYPADGGSSVLCSSVYRPDILNYARGILKYMNWVGFADFDFIYDPRRDLVMLIEINPRFPESYGVAYASGINFAKLMYQVAMGEKIIPVHNYKLGQYFRFLPGDVLWFLTSPNRCRTEPSFFDFFNTNVHYQILSLRDPGPTIAYLIENIGMLFNNKTREERFKLKRI
jgi:predicted ATP-grasp superfamily ATP-dependent carboligase